MLKFKYHVKSLIFLIYVHTFFFILNLINVLLHTDFIFCHSNNFGISGYAEDVPDIGIFTYRLKGFDEQPTDHYLRTFYVDASPKFKYQKPFCYGSMPRHQVLSECLYDYDNNISN